MLGLDRGEIFIYYINDHNRVSLYIKWNAHYPLSFIIDEYLGFRLNDISNKVVDISKQKPTQSSSFHLTEHVVALTECK